jgi:hypothetical protein
MSRYNAITTDGREMAFGYDRPLQEYFMCVYDEKGDLVADFSSSGNSMVRKHPPASNSKMHSMITQTMCNEDAVKYEQLLQNIILDLPF